MNVFVVESSDGFVNAVFGSLDRAIRFLNEGGWIQVDRRFHDFAWGWRYMDDHPDPSKFDLDDGWVGANIYSYELLT